MKNFTSCLLLICLFIYSKPLKAQDFNQYVPLVCKGNIPNDYIVSSAQKYQDEIKLIDDNELRRREVKDRKAFALETNFVLDDLLQSGLVLFNDEVTNYLNDVIGVLLKAGGMERKVQVYTLRSTGVNAFASDRGDVFVTLGMLAQLENEAQLAYILAHELTHVREKHSIELFLENENIDRETNQRKVMSGSVFDEKLLSKCAYSKEIESEADREGLQLFFKTDYSAETLLTVFDMLKYAYLPFDEVPFEMDLFQFPSDLFPKEFSIKKKNPIAVIDEYEDDSRSTHPNIGKRRGELRASLNHVSFEGKSNFLLPQERFEKAREMARFEMPLLYLHQDEFPDAVYTSHLLLKKYPESIYPKKCIAKALYLNAKYKNNNDVFLDNSYKEIEGESQQVHFLFHEMNKEGASALAMRYVSELLKSVPNDEELLGMKEDLFIVLASQHDDLGEFYQGFPIVEIDTLAQPNQPAQSDSTELSKYDKIRRQESLKIAAEGDKEYWRYALAGLVQDEQFVEAFAKGKKIHEEREEKDNYYNSYKGEQEWEKELKRRDKNGVALGIDKIVIVNPHYLKIDTRKNRGVLHIRTEQGQDHIRNLIEEILPMTDLKADILDVCNLSVSDSEVFNDIRFLNEWYGEQVNRIDLSLTPGVNQNNVNEIAEKYGTDYFLWTGVVSLREKNRKFNWIDFVGIISFWPATPFIVSKKVRPRFDMLHYAMLFDVRTGRRQVLKFDFYARKDTEGILRAHLYDTFSQINKKQ